MNSASKSEQPNEGVLSEDDIMEGNDFFAGDEIRLLTIFPLEIWLLLSDHLTDCEKHHLSNASPFFRKLLFKNRKLFLFRNTLQHLAPYLVRSKGEKGTGSTILNCRVVCQTWNKAVDWYFADPEISRNITKFIKNSEEQRIINNALIKEFSNVFFDGQNMANYLHQFLIQPMLPTRNPFIGRTVSITYRKDSDRDKNFMNAITTLLQNYGVHIQHLKVQLRGNNRASSSSAKSYSTLALWLQHVSQVYSIGVKCNFMGDNRADLHLPTLPVSTLQHLKSLKLNILPNSLVKSLVWENNQNLTELTLHQEIPQPDDNSSFSNLRKFSGPIKSQDQVLKVLGFLNNCKLHTLKLYNRENFAYQALKDAETLECFEILKIVADKWGNTLEILELVLANENTLDRMQKYMQESARLRLNLPCLRMFRLEVPSPLHLDFLLAAKNSLVNVDIKTCQIARAGDLDLSSCLETTVKFLGFEHRIFKSNIWTVFPKMLCIATHLNGERCNFRRQDWEKFIYSEANRLIKFYGEKM